MRKIIVSEMITLDGFFEGPNGEIDWHMVDESFNAFAIDQLNAMDALLFGRVTYQVMASWWPTEMALTTDPVVAKKMNAIQKLVFSRTLKSLDWENSVLLKGEIRETVRDLKAQPGKDIAIFGSGTIVSALTELGLIDEYRLFYNPIVLGAGKRLFQGTAAKVQLKTIRTQVLDNGVVLMCCIPLS